MRKHGVYCGSSGEPVLNLEAIQPDCPYELFNNNILIKESTGVRAYYDSDFRTAINKGYYKSITVRFLPSGLIYSDTNETKMLSCCMKCIWKTFSSIKIYLPFEIEQNILSVSSSQKFIQYISHFSYSFGFAPLHFFGIRGITKKGEGEFFFISDTISTTPVLQIETDLPFYNPEN
jgi:hypothetical protein